MSKISPHLWFDTQAKEAAELYTSVIPGSRITHASVLKGTPSGDTEIVSFELAGQSFMAISAGPRFKFNPSISFLIACASKDEVSSLWSRLSEGGTVMMPLDRYPFSDWYGWTTDRYGLSWQVMLTTRPSPSKITPTWMFTGRAWPQAEPAMTLYTAVFPDSRVDHVDRYRAGEEPDREGTLRHAGFTLAGHGFAVMDSGHPHGFDFSEAISFVVHCDSQDEIDHYWSRLSAVPEAEQCGWLKDRFGVSWQIVPEQLHHHLKHGTPEQIQRVTRAFLQMKKFDLAKLEAAYEGRGT